MRIRESIAFSKTRDFATDFKNSAAASYRFSRSLLISISDLLFSSAIAAVMVSCSLLSVATLRYFSRSAPVVGLFRSGLVTLVTAAIV